MTNYFCDPYAILFQVYGSGAYLKQAVSSVPIEELHRARTVKIVYGVMENDLLFDHYIRAYAAKNPKLPVRIILKIALYMLLFMDKKRYMVTDNAVTFAKKLGKGGAGGFINAFLRAFDKDKAVLPKEEIKNLSVRYSYPEFAVKRLLKEYGEDAEKIMSAKQQGVFVRFACGEEKIKEYIKDSAQATPFEKTYCFPSFRRDEGYDAGEYTFQSVGSVAICEGVKACENLLDACAAPGGKSVLLSEKCKKVTSFELHEHRAALIQSYASRMGAKNIEIVCRDSSVYDEAYAEKFDAVLVDAPCSGFGVVNENPDIKFFRKEEDLIEINKTQKRILEACCKYVKKGGMLYYSTCSVFSEENDGVVGGFLKDHTDFAAQDAQSPLPFVHKKYGIQFLPHISMGAGFYFSAMQKKG